MNITVDFDGETQLGHVEIEDGAGTHKLASEAHAELIVTEMLPKDSFCLRGFCRISLANES